jgi:hypothetical protein
MKHLKEYKQFEGLGSWVRGKFNSDEKTVEGILKKMDKLDETDIKRFSMGYDLPGNIYRFTLDGFDIEVREELYWTGVWFNRRI